MHVSSDRRASALEPVIRQAGGVLVMRDDRAVVAHYGSAAGELAACVSAVGLADRSDLAILQLDGPAPQLRHLSQRLAGSELAPGGAARSGIPGPTRRWSRHSCRLAARNGARCAGV